MPTRDKREQIMQAAEKLFANRRFHELTLDEVAHAAKVGKGTIYRHFKDKDDLFFQTATSGFEDMCGLLHKIPEEAPFRERLLTAVMRISGFFEKRRQLFRMMQTEEGRVMCHRGAAQESWLAKRKLLEAAVADIIRQGCRVGAIRGDIPPEVLAQFLLGMLRTRGRDLAEAPEDVRRPETLVELFTRGAGVCGASETDGR